ncbi:MAG: SufE family protein [Deltaproteobacteria bacterium]|nr:SufE family protein [Deltaproteobacteria bacterium]
MEVTLERILENFEVLDDWADRYRYIIDLGKRLPRLPEHCRQECNRINGCVSQVWLVSGSEADATRVLLEEAARDAGARPSEYDPRCPMWFGADSDAHIVRGLIAILMHMFCGKTPEEILALDPKPIFEQMGLDSHLSVSRSNGLHAMVKRVKQLAAEQIARQNNNGSD